MLEVRCPEYLEDVRVFAASIGKADQLQEQLDCLDNYGNAGLPAGAPERVENRCVLSKDFAPHSFAFAIYRPAPAAEQKSGDPESAWRYWFNGGLIFYGPRDSGVGTPQFSVSLDQSNEARWEIHT